VAWLALVPLLVALHGATGLQAARLGYVAGAVSATGVLYWTSLVVVQYGGVPLVAGVLIMLALCLAFAIFPLLFGWAVGRLVERFGTLGLLGAPFLWVTTELLRAHTFFEFPWCLLGYSQLPFLPVIQIASVTAVYGVSFLLVGFSALVAIAIVELRLRRVATLAAAALEVYAREDRLRQEIRALHVQIDEAKRARQVAEIADTDYFQTLQRKARQLRERI